MLGPAAIMVADGVEDAVARNGGQKLLNVQSQQDGADSSEDEVVDQEQPFCTVTTMVLPPFSATPSSSAPPLSLGFLLL